MNIKTHIDRLWILMQREMWENRIGYVWAPLVVSALIVTMLFMTMFMVYKVDSQHVTTTDMLRLFATETPPEHKAQAVGGSLLGIQVFFGAVMFFVTVFYLLGALYDDRKDRSILFWKSLPVSDSLTVFSKLASACLLIPALFLIAIMVTQLVVLLFASGYSLAAGINPWTNFWAPAQLFSTWGVYILATLIQALWLAPLWGWLLLCSSFAPRLPLLFAVAIPVLVSWVQSYINIVQRFDFKSETVLHYVAERITGAVLPLALRANFGDESIVIGMGEDDSDAINLLDQSINLKYLGDRLLDPALWTGLLVAALFLAGAIYFRRRASDS